MEADRLWQEIDLIFQSRDRSAKLDEKLKVWSDAKAEGDWRKAHDIIVEVMEETVETYKKINIRKSRALQKIKDECQAVLKDLAALEHQGIESEALIKGILTDFIKRIDKIT